MHNPLLCPPHRLGKQLRARLRQSRPAGQGPTETQRHQPWPRARLLRWALHPPPCCLLLLPHTADRSQPSPCPQKTLGCMVPAQGVTPPPTQAPFTSLAGRGEMRQCRLPTQGHRSWAALSPTISLPTGETTSHGRFGFPQTPLALPSSRRPASRSEMPSAT